MAYVFYYNWNILFFKNLLRDLEFKPFLHQNLIGAFDLMIKINHHERHHKLNFYVIYPKKKKERVHGICLL